VTTALSTSRSDKEVIVYTASTQGGHPGPGGFTRRSVIQFGGLLVLTGASVGSLAGCSSGTGSGSGGTKKIVWATGNDTLSIPHWKTSAEEFMADNPGVEIEFTLIPDGPLDAWLVARTTAGEAPDIVNMGVSAVGRYIGNGTAIDIGDYIGSGYIDDYIPAMRALVAKEEGVFGIPQQAACLATFYRTDMLQQIGFAPSASVDTAWTQDDVRTIAEESKKITGAYGLSYGFINANSGNRWLPILYQRGGALFKEDGTTPRITDEIGIEALEWTRKLYADGLISASNSVKSSQSDTATSLFINGQVGIMAHEDLAAMQTSGFDPALWDVDYLFRAETTAASLSGSVNVVTSSSRNPDVAAAFLAYASDREHTITRLRDQGGIAAQKGITAEEIGYAFRPEAAQKFITQLETVPEAIGRDMAGEDYQAVREALGDALDLLFTGSATAKETAERIAGSIG
jgi:multiple sugar transport system substrate-binding protein